MWLDYKLSKDMEEVRDSLVDEYCSWYGNKDKCVKLFNAFACIIYNTTFAIHSKDNSFVVTMRKESFSKPVIYNGVNTKRKVSYTYFIKAVNWLCECGLASLSKGGVVLNGYKTEKQRSILTISETLINRLTKGNETIPDVLQVRNEKKEVIEKRLTSKEKALVKMLNTYNFHTRKFDITVGKDYYDIQLRKVYNNNSFKCGGRSYVTGKGAEIMQKELRKKILINGKPTVEIDFKSLHASLIAEMIGYKFPDDFDPYGIEIDGYDKDVLRKIAKMSFLCLFNAKDFNKAIGAVSSFLREYVNEDGAHIPTQWKEKGLTPQIIEVKRILQTLAKHNQYAQDWMMSGRGVELQNVDSRIMDLVIQQFLDIDEFVLPVHDSVVVEKVLQDFAVDAMGAAYKQVLGSSYNCKLTIK